MPVPEERTSESEVTDELDSTESELLTDLCLDGKSSLAIVVDDVGPRSLDTGLPVVE